MRWLAIISVGLIEDMPNNNIRWLQRALQCDSAGTLRASNCFGHPAGRRCSELCAITYSIVNNYGRLTGCASREC